MFICVTASRPEPGGTVTAIVVHSTAEVDKGIGFVDSYLPAQTREFDVNYRVATNPRLTPVDQDTAENSDEYLTPRDAARMLSVSGRTVSRWADQGRISHIVTLGGHRRFRRADVERLVDSSRRDNAPTE